jgi:hypothetical protein
MGRDLSATIIFYSTFQVHETKCLQNAILDQTSGFIEAQGSRSGADWVGL